MKKNKIWIIIGILMIFLYFCSVSQYPANYKLSYLLGFFDFSIITLIMITIPLIYKVMKEEHLEKKRAIKVCKWNSIIIFILSISILIISGGKIRVGVGLLGTIIYYHINVWLFTNESSNLKNNKTKIITQKKQIEDNSTKKITMYCKLCGGKLNINKKCTQCGKKYFKITSKFIATITTLLSLLLLISIVSICIIFQTKLDKNKYDIKKYLNEIRSQKKEISNLENNLTYTTKGYTIDYNRIKIDFFDKNIVFIIEGYGNHYYSYDCMLKKVGNNSYSYWAYNKEQAISLNYKEGTC